MDKQCPCSTVIYKDDIESSSVVVGEWSCVDCGSGFVRVELATKLVQEANELIKEGIGKHAELIVRSVQALEVAGKHGTVAADRRKAWVIDQMVRALTGPGYESWLGGEEWDIGAPPYENN
jgi:hypothetical protein